MLKESRRAAERKREKKRKKWRQGGNIEVGMDARRKLKDENGLNENVSLMTPLYPRSVCVTML